MRRGGCIIPSVFLGGIKEAFDGDPELSNLLLDPYFMDVISRCQDSWRRRGAHAYERRDRPRGPDIRSPVEDLLAGDPRDLVEGKNVLVGSFRKYRV